MTRASTLAMVLIGVGLAGCSSINSDRKAPFRHSSIVAEWDLVALRESVRNQRNSQLHPAAPNIITLKRYPNPKELQGLEAAILPDDKIIEFKNDDWWVGFDAGSKEAERAFCVVRSSLVVKSVSIWSADE